MDKTNISNTNSSNENGITKPLLSLFISQDFESLNSNHFSIIPSVVTLIEEVAKPLCYLKLTSGRDVYTKEHFAEEFEHSFGIPYCSSNLRNLRLNQLSQSESVVFIQTSKVNYFSNFELGYNLNRGGNAILPMVFILTDDIKSSTTNPIEDLKKNYPDIPISIIRFNNVDEIRVPLIQWINEALDFKTKNCPTLGITVTENTFENENIVQERIRIGQFRENNANVFGTRYSDRFNEKFNVDKEHDFDLIKKATLFLKSGIKMKGFSFGANVSRAGEAVFHTSMIGYPECLSDPSYRGQILICSSIILGQYGVPEKKRDRYGLLERFESEDIHVAGLVITDYSFNYSHFQAVKSLSAWLNEYNIPAIYGWEVDTRTLILHIRETGSETGKIVQDGTDPFDIPYFDPNLKILSEEVSVKEPKYYPGTGPFKIVLLDFGVKQNMIRCLMDRSLSVLVVPWDWDLEKETFHGIMLSNGPGDPKLLETAIKNVRKQLKKEEPVPILGVCMGNQIMGWAAGGKTYKMSYGNRGHNQPVVDVTTGRSYITSQNHGFAIDVKSLPADWIPYFINLNDHTNEGIKHLTKPFYSAQFHPEAAGGPWDTRFLFDLFYRDIVSYTLFKYHKPLVRLTENPQYKNLLPGQNIIQHTTSEKMMSPYIFEWTEKRKNIRKVLIIGSGPLQIGQAGEFDYSGCQALWALKEENIKTILVNPNIATIQTRMEGMADRVYLVPLTIEAVTDVIIKERPDGVLLGFGGQTALNLGIRLGKEGILDEYRCQVLGTPIKSIEDTEDRDLFNKRLLEINEPIAKSRAATSLEEALIKAKEIGYPVICRAAYALGGLGSGFAETEEELSELCKAAFVNSPQVLIEKDLRGWKELEYEVVRDAYDNCITPAALENFNPMGIHTGESIVITPLMTITDDEHFLLRQKALKIVRHLGIVGECNIQFCMHPKSHEIYIIEVNARLSRSSALASKATCYPLAYIAAKLALGYPLPKIPNIVTSVTTAFFEPSLDYIVLKIPKWDLVKFNGVSRKLGSMMKSVGEIMSIGRNFEETLQKGLRMIDPNIVGFYFSPESKAREEFKSEEGLVEEFKRATDRQIFAIFQAIYQGWNIERIHQLSKIDLWFLAKLERIVDLHKKIESFGSLDHLPAKIMKEAKQFGFSDRQIALILKSDEISVRKVRKAHHITPFVKKIDTLGGEFPCVSNNLYVSYNANHDEIEYQSIDPGVIVVGSGCYRIGSSVEFDWCGVELIRELKDKLNFPTIMINNNPETVSTDHVTCDRLYFEEITFERVMDIYEKENPVGMTVSFGGQLPNNLAVSLEKNGARLLGTSSHSIDMAEDRIKFSSLCNELGIHQPEWTEFTNIDDGLCFANKVGFPVICRPSYVLSGAAMRLIYNKEEFVTMLTKAADVSPNRPVCVSKYIEDAMEIDFDGVSQSGNILAYAVSQHIETAGVHSGDSTLVLPAPDLNKLQRTQIYHIAAGLCKKLAVNGPFNLQFLYKDNVFQVIEMNLRASRSFPFICKTLGINFMNIAARILTTSEPLQIVECDPEVLNLNHYCVKSPKFSFRRLIGSDPVLGLEMASTGEVGCIGYDPYDALLKSMMAVDMKIPEEGGNIMIVSEVERALKKFNRYIGDLTRIGYNVYYFSSTEVKDISSVAKCLSYEQALNMISSKNVHLFLSFANPSPAIYVETLQAKLRKAAFIYNSNPILDPELANWFCNALINQSHKRLVFDTSLQEYNNPGLVISPLKSPENFKKKMTPQENFLMRKQALIESMEKKNKNLK
jgi:carbamoyl-phosphate synthase large subunit/carbamoyl-phosphate synthase small subunit